MLFAPQFDWLPLHRNIWYNLGRQMEQFDDIRNVLRNPDYKGTELFVNRNQNCLLGKQKPILIWIGEDTQRINIWKIRKFLSLLGWQLSVGRIQIVHIHQEIMFGVMKSWYNWFMLKNDISYSSHYFGDNTFKFHGVTQIYGDPNARKTFIREGLNPAKTRRNKAKLLRLIEQFH